MISLLFSPDNNFSFSNLPFFFFFHPPSPEIKKGSSPTSSVLCFSSFQLRVKLLLNPFSIS